MAREITWSAPQPERVGTFRRLWPEGTVGATGGGTVVAVKDERGAVLSELHLYHRLVLVDGIVRPVKAIGGVRTNRAEQGRGYATALLEQVLGISGLFCHGDGLREFYGGRGFVAVAERASYTQPGRGIVTMGEGWSFMLRGLGPALVAHVEGLPW